jgi:hypothetical protein
MNPTLSQLTIAAAHLRDPIAACSEWDAEFRSDLASFLSLEVVDAAMQGWLVLPPLTSVRYFAFVDAAGGSGSDSFTCALGHFERERVIVDSVREITPPFSPENATQEICDLLRQYRVHEVCGDRFAGEWAREQFEKRGIRHRVAELNRSEIYLESVAAFTAGRVELPRIAKLKNQLVMLDRKTTRIGRDSVDHPAGAHDDIANSACGVIVETLRANNAGSELGLVKYFQGIAAGTIPHPDRVVSAPLPAVAQASDSPCTKCGAVARAHRQNRDLWTCSSCTFTELRCAVTTTGMSRREYFSQTKVFGRGSFGRG